MTLQARLMSQCV